MSRSRRKKNLGNSYLITLGASLLSIILGFALLMFEEFILGAFLLILGFAVGLRTFLRQDEAKRPHQYYRVKVGKPHGYTPRVKVLIISTGVMLIITALVGIDSIWPLIATFILLIFTMMYYLIDVRGKKF